MSKYRICLLPGNSEGKKLWEETIPILEALSFPAEYIWAELESSEKARTQNLEMMKGTSCALAAPRISSLANHCVDIIPRIRTVFQLHTRMYVFQTLELPPNRFAIINQNREESIQFYPILKSLRTILESHHPSMARFAPVNKEDIHVSLAINTKTSFLSTLQETFSLAQNYGYPEVLFLQDKNEGNPFLTEENIQSLPPDPKRAYQWMDIENLYPWLMQEKQQNALFFASQKLAEMLGYVFHLRKPGFSAKMYLGNSYCLCRPVYALGLATPSRQKFLSILLSFQMMLRYFSEKEMAAKLGRVVEKFSQQTQESLAQPEGDLDYRKSILEFLKKI